MPSRSRAFQITSGRPSTTARAPMCGDSARTWFTSSATGRVRSRSRSAAVIFSAYVAPSAGWGAEHGLGQHVADQACGNLGRARVHGAGVVVGPDVECLLRGDRAGVELGRRAMDRDAGLRVAGHERALDRRRTAPARQERRMHVEPEPAVEQRVGDEQAVRGDDDRVGGDLDALVELGGLRDGNPEPLGRLLGGGRRELAAATARLVGTREQQHDLVLGGEALEDVGAEGGGRCDRDPGHG